MFSMMLVLSPLWSNAVAAPRVDHVSYAEMAIDDYGSRGLPAIVDRLDYQELCRAMARAQGVTRVRASDLQTCAEASRQGFSAVPEEPARCARAGEAYARGNSTVVPFRLCMGGGFDFGELVIVDAADGSSRIGEFERYTQRVKFVEFIEEHAHPSRMAAADRQKEVAALMALSAKDRHAELLAAVDALPSESQELWLAQMLRIRAHIGLGHKDTVKELVDAHNKRWPARTDSLFLFDAYAVLGRVEEALATVDAVEARVGKDSALDWMRSVAHELVGDLPAAYLAATGIDPDDVDIPDQDLAWRLAKEAKDPSTLLHALQHGYGPKPTPHRFDGVSGLGWFAGSGEAQTWLGMARVADGLPAARPKAPMASSDAVFEASSRTKSGQASGAYAFALETPEGTAVVTPLRLFGKEGGLSSQVSSRKLPSTVRSLSLAGAWDSSITLTGKKVRSLPGITSYPACGQDIALFEAVKPSSPGLSLADADPKVGAEVWVHAPDLDDHLARVASTDDGCLSLVFESAQEPDSIWGAPVVDAEGRVVGMLTSHEVRGGFSMGSVISADRIRSLSQP